MSLNNIIFPPQLVIDLYSGVLIESDSPQNKKDIPVRYLGKNEKQILITTADPEVPVINDTDLQFLTTVLSALNLSLADVAIINTAHYKDQGDIHAAVPFSKAILFGVTPPELDLPIDFPAYQVQQFADRTYLHASPLKELHQNKELKMQLWNALKRMFSIV